MDLDKFNNYLKQETKRLNQDFLFLIKNCTVKHENGTSNFENLIYSSSLIFKPVHDLTHQSLTTTFRNIEKKTKAINKAVSSDFNILKLVKLNETAHSFLLANILDPSSSHGQDGLFLNIFLNKLGIEQPEKGNWKITVEKGKVDILLKRKNPHSIIIIENKSNNAVDQPNQLYRYWYNEIYLPYKNQPMDFAQKNNSRYKLLYLVSNDWKKPTNDTTLKPKGWSDFLPVQLPMETLTWKYDTEITEILFSALSKIPSDNHRLKEYINQYIEFWQ